MVKSVLKLEGSLVLFGSLYFYQAIHANWIVFVLFFLVPDFSMLGYLKNHELGAITYNLIHNYVLALLLILLGFKFHNQTAMQFGLILSAHIGMDRMLGYGLKYPSKFKDTHLQKV